jgi:RNA polymerase sigma-70 factor (family 1)
LETQANHTDDRLLECLRNGDATAFAKIYRKYWYKIFSIAYQRVHEKEIAQELTQNLFLKLWEKRASLNIQKLESYLFVSIKHAVIDHIHSQLVVNNYREYCRVFSLLEEETTERMVALDEITDALEEGLTKLPEKSSEVFRLSRLNHWPVDKIASHLDLSEKTVRYHLTKSLKFLRTHLKEFTFFLLFLLFR